MASGCCWVRALDALTAQSLRGPTAQKIRSGPQTAHSSGFAAQRKLRKIHVSGASLQTLCDAAAARAARGATTGPFVFSANAGHQLYRVGAGGGPATSIAADGKNEERYWPSLRPTAAITFYRGRPQQHGMFVAALDSPDTNLLLDGYMSAAYSFGALVGLKGSSPGSPFGTLFAHRFDVDAAMQTTGDPIAVAGARGLQRSLARAAVSVSTGGYAQSRDSQQSHHQVDLVPIEAANSFGR